MNFSIKLRLLIIACFFLFSPLVAAIQCGICESREHSDNYCPMRVQSLSSRYCIMQDITAFLAWLNLTNPAVLAAVNSNSGGAGIGPQPGHSSVSGAGIVATAINTGRTTLSTLLGSITNLISSAISTHLVSAIPNVNQYQITEWQKLDSLQIGLTHETAASRRKALDNLITSIDMMQSTISKSRLSQEEVSFQRIKKRRTAEIQESEQKLKVANQEFRNKLLKKAGIHRNSDTTLILEPSLGAVQLTQGVNSLFDFTSEFENADQHPLYPALSGLKPLIEQLIQALQTSCPIQSQVIFENNSQSMPLESINALIQQVGNVLHQPACTTTVTIFSPGISSSTAPGPLTHALHNIMVFTTHLDLNAVTIVVAPQVGVVAQLNNPLAVHTFVANYLSALASTNQVTQWSAMTFSTSPH